MLFFIAIAASIVAFVAWSTARKQGAPGAPLALLVAIGLVCVGFAQAVVVVPAGHVGVVDLFGRVSPQTLKSGLNLVNPLARIAKMSVKTQDMKEVMDVPSQEGLTVQLEVSALYHLDPEKAAEAIATELRRLVEPRGVTVEATPLRKLTLPARLAAAIEEKLGAEQESQRMQFVLTKEKQEADRRRIEAQGIADFQKIVTTGINDQLLRWKGIEATLKIAESQNAKVVIVGSGKDGLPLIL